MSSIPDGDRAAQDPILQEVVAIAARLTPLQRHILALAGRPAWGNLPAPWQPRPGRQAAVAAGLASAEYQLIALDPAYLGAYQLTFLGELVTGFWLLDAIHEQMEAIAACN